MKEQCDYLLPSHYGYIGGSSTNADGALAQERPECLLGEGHPGPHLCKFSDGMTIKWEPDVTGECGCTSQEMEDGECECFVFWEVTGVEAEERLREFGPQE